MPYGTPTSLLRCTALKKKKLQVCTSIIFRSLEVAITMYWLKIGEVGDGGNQGTSEKQRGSVPDVPPPIAPTLHVNYCVLPIIHYKIKCELPSLDRYGYQ